MRSESPPGEQLDHPHNAAWIRVRQSHELMSSRLPLPLPCRLLPPHHRLLPAAGSADRLLMVSQSQGLKGGGQCHGEEGAAVHLAGEAAPAIIHLHKGSSTVPPPPPGHEHGDAPIQRPSSNNTSSSGDTASSSDWPPPPPEYYQSFRMVVRPPPPPSHPSLEMSLGRQGWQATEHCGGAGGEFESSAAAPKERALLKCL
ncbi:hypothetical protein ACP70R_032424 [Stipagrostis hirtigluma subsp. patula]